MVKKAIQKFEITLDKQPLVYYTGETVSGRVSLQLQKPVKIKSIQANLYGRSNMHVNVKSNDHTHHIHKQEVFIEKTMTLWGDPNSKKNDLPPGTYEYNFSFVLQSEAAMPSSAELTKLGSNVRYEVNVALNNGKKSQHRAIKPFTFLETIDLSSPEYMGYPIPVEDERRLCCLCCLSAPIRMTVRTDRRGYCPGDNIRFNIDCENLSSKTISYLQVEFIRILFLKGKKGHKYRRFLERYQNFKSDRAIRSGQTYTLPEQAFTVPSISPAIESKYITVKYELQITAKVNACGNKATIVPIIIGSLPSRLDENQLTSNPSPPSYNTAVKYDDITQQYPVVSTNSWMQPQPSNVTYTECIHGAFTIDKSSKAYCDKKFVPIYPVTNNSSNTYFR